MRERMKTILCIAVIIICLPIIVTMIFQGETILPDMDKNNQITKSSEQEEMLAAFVCILASEIPVSYQEEALRAQAVIVRTNYEYCKASGQEMEEGLTTQEMMNLFGQENYGKYYSILENAFLSTSGEILQYQNQLVEAPFFSVSAGQTRSAIEAFGQDNRPYLSSVESMQDITSSDYLKVTFFTPEELVTACNTAYADAAMTTEDTISQIEILEKEQSGYVKNVRIGNKTITGEALRKTLDLNSAYFSITQVDDSIRIVTKGLGHGVGLSIYGANELAKEGMTYQEILKYYYKDIEITKE